MDYLGLLEKVEAAIEPVLNSIGLELVEREFLQSGGQWVLRLYIDRQEGKEGKVTIDDCADASRAVGNVLDVEDLIPTAYVLEVSSPGLNRPLRKRQDFERFAGNMAELKTKEPIDGRSHFSGTLKGLLEESVVIEQGNQKWMIPLTAIKKAKLKR